MNQLKRGTRMKDLFEDMGLEDIELEPVEEVKPKRELWIISWINRLRYYFCW